MDTMKGKGSGWKNESRRHSLARKGIKTADGIIFESMGKIITITPETEKMVLDHLKGLNEWEYLHFINNKKLGIANMEINKVWEKTGKYPDRDVQKEIWDKAKNMTIKDMIENGFISIYMVKPDKKYDLTFGSTTRNPSGTSYKVLKGGEILIHESGSSDNTQWFIHEGKRGKSEYGAYGSLEDDLRLVKIGAVMK